MYDLVCIDYLKYKTYNATNKLEYCVCYKLDIYAIVRKKGNILNK